MGETKDERGAAAAVNKTPNKYEGNKFTRHRGTENDKDFAGATPEIGGILCVPAETHLNKRVGFVRFKDLLATYIVKSMKDGVLIVTALDKNLDPVAEFDRNFRERMSKGTAPTAGTIEDMILREEVKEFVTRKRGLEMNITKIFALVWGQCTEPLQATIRLQEEYQSEAEKYNGIWLLGQVELRMAGIMPNKNDSIQLRSKLLTLLLTKQYEHESVHEYMTRFKANSKGLKMFGGDRVLCFEKLMELKYEQVMASTVTQVKKDSVINLSTEAFESVCFLMGSNNTIFGSLKTSLAESMNVGRNEYPTTLQSTYELLVNTEMTNKKKTMNKKTWNNKKKSEINVSFAQAKTPIPGKNGILHERVKCYKCNALGHYADNCPKMEDEAGEENTPQVIPPINAVQEGEHTTDGNDTQQGLQCEQTDDP